MADLSDTVGSDLPTMSDADQAAFAAEETAAAAARTDAKGGGHQRLAAHIEDGDGETTAAPKPAAAPAPAPAPAPTPAAVAAAPAPPAGQAPAEDDDSSAVLANDGKRYVPLETMLARRRVDGGKIKDQDVIIADLKKQNDLLMKIAEGKVVPAQPAAAHAPPPEPEKNPFDKTTHPLEHLEWKNEQFEKRIEAREKADKDSQEQTQHATALRGAQVAYQRSHASYAGANPQYADAYSFVMKTLVNANKALGYSDAEAIQAAESTEWNVVQRAVASNKLPSEMLWDLAKASGWQPPAAAAAGGAPAPAPAGPTPAKQIEIAQQGAAAAISLSDATGGSAPQPLTLASVATMSKEEFAQISDDQFLKLAMGQTGRRNAAAA